jgi:hypothetical protein
MGVLTERLEATIGLAACTPVARLLLAVTIGGMAERTVNHSRHDSPTILR